MKQLQPLTNGTNVAESMLDFVAHGPLPVALNQAVARVEVTGPEVGHQGVPSRVALLRQPSSTQQFVGGAAHGGKHHKFGHALARLQHVGHLHHGRCINQRTSSKFDDFHGVSVWCSSSLPRS